MVCPGLTENWMHAAVLNTLNDCLNIPKFLLATIVSNQQPCNFVGLCARIRKKVPFYAAFFTLQTAMNSMLATANRLAFNSRYRRFL